MKAIIRTVAFVAKEIREVVRQPSLLLVLILGPFLILLLFGLGHSAIAPPLRAILVIPRGVELPIAPDRYQDLLGSTMKLVAVSNNADGALVRLRQREVDIAVLIPNDLQARLASGEQAMVTVAYNEIDPVRTSYIRFVAFAQISEMNRQILQAEITRITQREGQLGQFSAIAGSELDGVEADLASGNALAARQRIARLDQAARGLEIRVDLLGRFLPPEVEPGQQTAVAQRLANTRASLARFRADLASLDRDVEAGSPRLPQDVVQLRAGATEVSRNSAELSDLTAQVIAAPLASQTTNVAPVAPDFVAFFAPAVLALLLQHIAVTFAALSIVRERLFGAMELFRVAPIGAVQILVGKYLAYLLLGLVVTAGLTALLLEQLDVPFGGSYQFFVAVVVGLILASLGIGFCISLLSDSERQAVQLSMLVLIASVFFSGFFLRLESFSWPFRGVAYVLPVSYGIQYLQEIMLRANNNVYSGLQALGVITLVLFIAAVWLLRRELSGAEKGRGGAD